MDALDKHKTGAVCPTSKHRGVIFNVSGFTFLEKFQPEILIVKIYSHLNEMSVTIG